jgi:hypothetical protein
MGWAASIKPDRVGALVTQPAVKPKTAASETAKKVCWSGVFFTTDRKLDGLRRVVHVTKSEASLIARRPFAPFFLKI